MANATALNIMRACGVYKEYPVRYGKNIMGPAISSKDFHVKKKTGSKASLAPLAHV